VQIETLQIVFQQIQSDPSRMLPFVFLGILTVAISMFFTGYLSELGRRMATPQSAPPEQEKIIQDVSSPGEGTVEIRDSINYEENLRAVFNRGCENGPLNLADGTVCGLEIGLTMKVTHAAKAFQMWSDGGPNRILMPAVSSRTRQFLEPKSVAEIAKNRQEIGMELIPKLQGAFEKHGYFLEAYEIMSIDPLGHR
jgi:hypothetical protein